MVCVILPAINDRGSSTIALSAREIFAREAWNGLTGDHEGRPRSLKQYSADETGQQ